jgi:choline dehydrogenase-like flavoprotein
MLSPYLPSDETRRAYHSGLSGRVFDPADLIRRDEKGQRDRSIIFQTARYGLPFHVTLRAGPNWETVHQGRFDSKSKQWRFTLPGGDFPGYFEMKFVLDERFWMVGENIKVFANEGTLHFGDGHVIFAYEASFQTSHWQPNHLITLRNSVDGWWRDIYGTFRDNKWIFRLDRDIYPDAFEAKLVLDRHHFMNGANLQLDKNDPLVQLNDAQVVFSATPTAFRHGYDNLVAVATPHEQYTIRAAGREEDEYDVIVIGSGMGGGILADALSDLGKRVLVLEAGGLRFPVHMNELPRTEIDLTTRDRLGHFVNVTGDANPWFQPGVHFNLGGRSIYWSGLIPRMQDWELRPIWPDSVKDYLTQTPAGGLSGYQRAERVMRKCKTLGPFQNRLRDFLNQQIGDEFVATDLPRSLHQPNMRRNGKLLNVVQRSTGGFSTADLLLDSLGFSNWAGRDNLKVNLHHLTTHIETADGRAEEVVCQDLIGRVERRYRGESIVLACGSLETPKLTINSTLDDPNSKMGKGLTDHPAYFYQIHHPLSDSGPLGWIGDRGGHAKIILRHKNATAAAHAYHVELLVNARFWDTRHADDDLWRQVADNTDASKVEIKFIFDSPLNDNNYVRPVTPNGVGKKVEVYVEPNDTAAGYKDEMVEVRNLVLSALGVTGLSNAWDDNEWSQGIYGTVHHAGGTMRMSDDGSGVVDENLKLLSYENLYCCDVSVFPSIPAANPSLTLAALALRLADTLAGNASVT